MKKLAVLISGTGRNLTAIINAVESGALPAELCLVLSNRADAEGLRRAADAGLPAVCLPHKEFGNRAAFDKALSLQLDKHAPDIIALAGFMRVLGDEFVLRYQGRLLNIHPSLLPAYRGLHTHQRALEAGDPWHGASVHYVTPELDDGPVVLQGRTAIRPTDTVDSLGDRVMQEVEQQIYPLALAWEAEGRLTWQDNRAWLDGAPLDQPLMLEDLPAETAAISRHSGAS